MTTTQIDEDLACVLCHQPGGWTFRDYGAGRAHSDCIDRVGADYRPTLDELQRAERDMWPLGYCFRDGASRMAGTAYHDEHVRRYHIWGYDLHFASWSSFQRWLADAWSYFDFCNNYYDEQTDQEWD